LPAANCQSTLGPNGTITIYVPLSMVSEPGAVDNRLHEVTASTMTLTQPANTNPDLGGTGIGAGSLFNLIDVAQGYVFDPNRLRITSITHLANGHIQIQGLSASNVSVRIEASPDLITPFTTLSTVLADADGTFQFEDANAGSFTKRFYRAASP
jgi:hypothetical protein